MRVLIKSTNIELTPAIENYIERKLVKCAERLVKAYKSPDLPTLDIEVGKSTKHHKKGKVYYAEVNLSLDGKKILRSRVNSEDLYTACDLAKDELEREIVSFKEKRDAVQKRGARKAKREFRFDPAARLNR